MALSGSLPSIISRAVLAIHAENSCKRLSAPCWPRWYYEFSKPNTSKAIRAWVGGPNVSGLFTSFGSKKPLIIVLGPENGTNTESASWPTSWRQNKTVEVFAYDTGFTKRKKGVGQPPEYEEATGRPLGAMSGRAGSTQGSPAENARTGGYPAPPLEKS